MKRVLFLSLVFISLFSFSQESIKVMHYNLLYYGKTTSFCTSDNNNIDHKNNQLKTIINYVQPDIFCVNEMDASLADVNYLMDNVLNINGISHWKHAQVSGSYMINMLYYNSDKIHLVSQESIEGYPRQTDVYHLELVNNPEIKWTVFSTHLKAGNSYENREDRAYSTEKIMNFLANRNIENFLLTGDLNLYQASEQAFQNLTNPNEPDIAFNDPINRLGNWSSNPSFADVHTQATHSANTGCFSHGGIDDRFDFILVSNAIKNGTHELAYKNNSYTTIGQDGNHYNQAINEGSNNSAPENVIEALYEMSDHLPVSLTLIQNGQTTSTEILFNKDFNDQDLTSGGWSHFSVKDNERTWYIPSSQYGHNNSYCAKMSGWDASNHASVDNEDWLISPLVNMGDFAAPILHFWTAGKYNGTNLELLYSYDYSGTGDPNNANWTALDGYELSLTDNFEWKPSGNISLSEITDNFYIAFKYTSTPETGARAWQIDDIVLTAISSNEDISGQVAYTILPNPAYYKINVRINKTKLIQNYRLELYNNIGIKVATFELTDTDNYFDVSSLGQGLYFAKIGNSVQKLIIQR